VNHQIRIPEVFLIDQTGNKIGVVQTEKAKILADEAGLDLVEIVPTAKPPVCKIIDFGKYKFELEKKAKDAKKNQQVIKIKEIRVQPEIDKHDYDFKLAHTKEFLQKGNKVKITVRFKGRQMAHMDIGEKLLMRFVEDLKEIGSMDSRPNLEGKMMSIVMTPLGKKK
jgi:translation initiation factor IF-3